MSDRPQRLDRFVEALRRGRRPEHGLAGSPEEVEDLRHAARLAGAGAPRGRYPHRSRPWYPVAAFASLPIDAGHRVASASVPLFILRGGRTVRALSRACTHQACLLQFDSS